MSIESALKTVLGTSYPVYALSVPKLGEYPCYVYQRVGTRQMRHSGGNGNEVARVQLSCWGETYGEAVMLAGLAKSALDLNQINFDLVVKDDEYDDKEKDTEFQRKILVFTIKDFD